MTKNAGAAAKTWVTIVPTNARLAEACEEFSLTEPALLLVLSTTQGPQALAKKLVRLGLPDPTDKKPKISVNPIIEAHEASITEFARQHPDRLLAKSGTGIPSREYTESGARYTVWADLEPSIPPR